LGGAECGTSNIGSESGHSGNFITIDPIARQDRMPHAGPSPKNQFNRDTMADPDNPTADPASVAARVGVWVNVKANDDIGEDGLIARVGSICSTRPALPVAAEAGERRK
jgi:hypothetical protein